MIIEHCAECGSTKVNVPFNGLVCPFCTGLCKQPYEPIPISGGRANLRKEAPEARQRTPRRLFYQLRCTKARPPTSAPTQAHTIK